jgi:hypothetical protein
MALKMLQWLALALAFTVYSSNAFGVQKPGKALRTVRLPPVYRLVLPSERSIVFGLATEHGKRSKAVWIQHN